MKKKNSIALLSVVFLVALIFAAIEIIEPYYFLIDDNENYFVYVYKYTYDAITSGTIPLYNFRQFLGAPFFSVGQTGAINPLVIISCFLSNLFLKSYAGTVDIMAFFHLEIAAVGMYFVLKKHDCKTVISVVGAIAWAFNTFNIFFGRSWMIVLQTTAWIPFVLLGTLYLYENLSLKGILISILPRLALFYCGHPQFFLWGMIFDFLYILVFVLFNNQKNKNNKRFVLYYAVSYIPVTLLALPLLGPMWNAMSSSALRSGKANSEQFFENLIDFKTVIPGVFLPFTKVQEDCVMNRVGGFTFILMLTFLIGVVASFFIKNSNLKSKIVSYYVLSVLSYLFSGSIVVVTLMYYIPVINSFRFNFKYFMWFPFFAIIASCMLLTYASDKFLKKEILRRIAQGTLTLVTVINIVTVCVFSPADYWSLKMSGNPSNPPSNLDELYKDNRYMCLAVSPYIDIDESNNLYGPDIYEMEFNIATALNYSNLLGYDTMTPSSVYNRLGDLKIDDYTGTAYPENTDFFEICNYLGVSTYVVNKYYIFCNSDLYSKFELTEIYEDDASIVCRTDKALPIVRTVDGKAINYEEKINSILVNTDESFQGGEILLMYSYNPYFKVKVNGKSSDIEVMENDYYTMKINAPAGANEIEIIYEDTALTSCLIAGIAGFSLFCGIGYLLMRKKEKTA